MIKKFFAIVLSITTLFSCGEVSFADENNSTDLNDNERYALCECTKALAPDEILLKLTENVIAKKRVSEIIPGMKKIFFEPAEKLERQIADFKKANEITFVKRIRAVFETILSTSIGGALGYLATSTYEKFKARQKTKEEENKSNDNKGKIAKKVIAMCTAICCFLGFIVTYCSRRNNKATEFRKLLDDLRVENMKRAIGLGGFRSMFEDDHSELPQNANKKHLLHKFKKDLEKTILEEEGKHANRAKESIDNLKFYKSIKLF